MDLVNGHRVLRITALNLQFFFKLKFSTIINLVSQNSAFSLFALKLGLYCSFTVDCYFKGSLSASKTYSEE